MHRISWIIVIFLFFLVIDFFVFQAVKTVTNNLSPGSRKIIFYIYWLIPILTFLGIFLILFVGLQNISSQTRNIFVSVVFGIYIAKIFVIPFLLIDDIQRFFRWLVQLFTDVPKDAPLSGTPIPRSEFLSKAGLIAATLPIVAMTYGITLGAHDYRIVRKRIKLKNLPSSFDGLTIAQISDIHAGSFYNKKAVMRGVEMLMNEKADLIFFTGDLVNNEAPEMRNYIDVFREVKAPLGVYSILGNHDYGEYIPWPTEEAKMKNFQDIINTHKRMGWDILLNENRILTKNGESIAILGVENWSARGNFPKYGKMKNAYKGTENSAVKLLLTHDPSHWRAQVIPEYKDVDITFSGHTHGFQFGVEVGNIKWSPVKYFYDEWAGLYQEKNQYLYVNRGFGFIGFPGRIGMPPEITIFELEKG